MGSIGYIWGCTVAAVPAHQPAEHVKNALKNFTTEWMTYRVGQKNCPTGCFRVRVNFDTPLISVIDGPILKSFEVVRANTG